MNCLTCHKLYNFYEKSTNCLKCLYFVNYLQTECIDSIPNGYYLFDENLKTIEKCHNLCKTCKKGPITKDNVLYMNCETCFIKRVRAKNILWEIAQKITKIIMIKIKKMKIRMKKMMKIKIIKIMKMIIKVLIWQ